MENTDVDEKTTLISKKYREKYLPILYHKAYKKVLKDINRIGLKILFIRCQLDIHKRPDNGIISLLCYGKSDFYLMFDSKDVKTALLMYNYV